MKWGSARHMKLWHDLLKGQQGVAAHRPPLNLNFLELPYFFVNSKGDINSAAKFLEMFVGVAEGAGLQENLADACSAIGTMYNTMVWKL